MTVIDETKLIPESFPVLVVGGGPVGLSLAIELRLHGIEVVVIDQDLDIADEHPKGRSNDLRTLEHYRSIRDSNLDCGAKSREGADAVLERLNHDPGIDEKEVQILIDLKIAL
ncbi:hypothetical protein PEBR_39517 [Penicillium brasilianum]|uniref:FAD-binding domain-containing protein n=1 Tax=Penicillium brasilianum TaxID=104259 RepID=A0A1S9RA67_PENBI|nr:hypothetical protein PEBR_39517 [Penicillium brasilianum]